MDSFQLKSNATSNRLTVFPPMGGGGGGRECSTLLFTQHRIVAMHVPRHKQFQGALIYNPGGIKKSNVYGLTC